MLETIISWCTDAASNLFDYLLTAFLQALVIDLGEMNQSFPALAAGYTVFQAIGLSLVVIMAGVQISKFFFGQLVDVKDTPVRILIRSGIAGMMIYFGGYILELIINVARIPYEAFASLDASTTFFESISKFHLISDSGVLSASAGLLLSLVMILLVGWNIFKLIIEVCERFILIGVLAYSAPLIYPFICSQSTGSVFKKWISMFCGQCALMTISAWMLKVIISGFTFDAQDTSALIQLALTLALCKIAQRTDTYMQQLGIGVATTGGNILDEAIGMAMAFSRGRRNQNGGANAGGNGGGNSPLGSGPAKVSNLGGVLGAAVTAKNYAKAAAASPDSTFGSVMKAAGKGAMDGAGITAGVEKAKQGGAANIAKGIGMGAVGYMTSGLIKNTYDRIAHPMKKIGNSTEAFNQRASNQKYYDGEGNPVVFASSDPNTQMANEAGQVAQQAQAQNYNPDDAITIGNEGDAQLSSSAEDLGMSMVSVPAPADVKNVRKADGTSGEETPKTVNALAGPADFVARTISSNMDKTVQSNDFYNTALATAKYGHSSVGQMMFFDAKNGLQPGQQMMPDLVDAYARNAFGDNITNLTPDGGLGKFVSASVEDGAVDGGRVVSFGYEDVAGNMRTISLADTAAVNSSTDTFDMPNPVNKDQADVSNVFSNKHQVSSAVSGRTSDFDLFEGGPKIHAVVGDAYSTKAQPGREDRSVYSPVAKRDYYQIKNSVAQERVDRKLEELKKNPKSGSGGGLGGA